MNRLQLLWQLVLADFRERTRRYSFLITLMVALFLGYLVLTGKYSYLFGPFKPVCNSAWTGTTVALAGAAIFAFMGFYVVRTSISRDRETRVGEILATTGLSRTAYLFAKFLSNLLVLWSMVGALVLTALGGMLVNMPINRIDLIEFLVPFFMFPLVVTIPVAAAAILFDTARWLRGATGNILYFFLAQTLVVSGLFGSPYVDAAGIGILGDSVKTAIGAVYPGESIPMSVGFVGWFEDDSATAAVKTFVWDGIDWSLPLVLARLIWPGLAILLLVVALPLFDRFTERSQPVRRGSRRNRKRDRGSTDRPASAPIAPIRYPRIPTAEYSGSVVPFVLAELRLGLKDLRPIWLLIGLGLVVSQVFAPFDIARRFLIPAAMIWPLMLWSSLGTRETTHAMRPLLFSSSGVHTRQFVAQVLTGVVIAALMASPTLVRAAISGDAAYFAALGSAVGLLPATAYAFGIVSRSRKLFEVIYPIIWYGGSIDRVEPLDLLATTSASSSSERTAVFAFLTLVAIGVAFLVRRQRTDD